ncbi:MAG: hypothetical protein ACM3IH_11195, partial [Sphingobacteriales bacterium]
GWYSELDEQQLGALFVSKKMMETRRPIVEKFVQAYRRGAADYAAALLRKDRNSKRTSDIKSKEAAATIARYVYPDRGLDAAAAVELGAITSTRRRDSVLPTSAARSPGTNRRD